VDATAPASPAPKWRLPGPSARRKPRTRRGRRTSPICPSDLRRHGDRAGVPPSTTTHVEVLSGERTRVAVSMSAAGAAETANRLR